MTTKDVVFLLLKKSLISSGTSSSENSDIDVSEVDWSAVYDLMRRHAIEFLPYDWLKEHPIPDQTLYASWMKACMIQKVKWIKLLKAQGELLSLLEEHNIPCVIIKGTAAAMAYEHPSCRATGDIDFLVKRSDYYKALELLSSNGYESLSENENHNILSKDGTIFELHRKLVVIDNTDEEALLMFEKEIDNRKIVCIDSSSFPVFPSPINGLVLMFHINQHLRDGLGLRQLIDWMMFVANADQETMDALIPLLKKTGLERLAQTVTVACQKYFGLNKEISNTSEQYPCEALIEYILNQGNFGCLDDDQYSKTFIRLQNPVEVVKFCDRHGVKYWPASKRFIFLRPFAWIFGACRIAAVTISKKPRLFDLWNQYRKGRKYRKLMTSLGLDAERTVRSDHH